MKISNASKERAIFVFHFPGSLLIDSAVSKLSASAGTMRRDRAPNTSGQSEVLCKY